MLLVILGPVTKVLVYILLSLLGFWCWFQWKHRRLIRAASKLYTTKFKPLPLIGHAHYIICDWSKATARILEAVEDAVSNGKDTMCFWCGPLPLMIVLGVDDIQKVLNNSITSEKADEYALLPCGSGNGLLAAPKSIWRITRRHINPLFHPRNLEQLMPTFNWNSRELVLKLYEHVDGDTFNVMEYTMETGLKTICNLIFGTGVEFDVESEEFRGLLYVVERSEHPYPTRYRTNIGIVTPRINKHIGTTNPLYLAHIIYQNLPAELRNTDHYSVQVFKKRIEARKINRLKEENKIKPVLKEKEETDHLSEGPLNLLQVYKILQDNFPSFTDKQLLYEMVTLYGAGTDTVGATISTGLLAIAQHQDIQEKLHKEISSVLTEDDDVTTQDLMKMPYLDQVYKETLRWASVTPFIGRKATEDIKLSSCTVPAGSTVLIGLIGLHLNPKNHPNPQNFNPDRFSQENKIQKDHSAYVPFSGGPRNCIGKTYAHMLIKVMLVHVVRKYKVFTTMDMHTMKRKFVSTLIATDGYNIQLEKRTNEK